MRLSATTVESSAVYTTDGASSELHTVVCSLWKGAQKDVGLYASFEYNPACTPSEDSLFIGPRCHSPIAASLG